MARQISKLAPSLRTIVVAAAASSPLFAGQAHASGLPFFAKPTHFQSEAVPEIATAGGGGCSGLTYQGGTVISKVQLVAVYWGNVGSFVTGYAPGFLQAIASSPYIDQLSEYNTTSANGVSGGSNQKIVRGSYLKAVQITPSNTATQLDNDQDIAPELESQVTSGKLPAPTYDAAGHPNTLYIVFFAPGISISLQGSGSCVSGGFCGYHYSTGTSKVFPYAVIPDMGSGSGCDTGCGKTQEAALGTTLSHEIAEAVTDADVGHNKTAWYDSETGCGEIGDICSPGGGQGANAGSGKLPGSQYTFQYEWSNKAQSCELTNPNVGPQGGCTKSSDCAAPTPACDTTGGSCVECVSNKDCSGNTPVCDTTSHTCHACTGASDCSAPTAICVTGDAGANAGKCVACEKNTDCTAAQPVCKANACTGCSTNADCPAGSPVCNAQTGACGAQGSGSGSGGSGSGGNGSGGNGSGGNGSGGNGSGGNGSGGNGSGGNGSGSGSGGNGAGGSGSGGVGGGGDNGGGTGSSGGCAVSDGPASGAFGFAGVLFGLAAVARAKRSRARR